MIFNQVATGGGGVDTAHITLSSMADHVYYTDANMTVQDNPMADDDMVIGTLVTFCYSMFMPESFNGLTFVANGGVAKSMVDVGKVTG